MSSIVLKTAKRSTAVSRAKVRAAVSAAYARPRQASAGTPTTIAKVTKRASSKQKRS